MINSIRIFLSLLLIFIGINSLKAQNCTITGLNSVCIGSSTTYFGSPSSGVWTSSDPSIASITSTGILTSVSLGSVTITYTVGNCVTTKIVQTKIVPILSPIDPVSICSGSQANVPLISSTGSNTTYAWSAVNNSFVTGESTTSQTSNTIANTLTLTGLNQQIVNYSIVPTFNGCSGVTTVLPVTVKPKPTLSINTVTTCLGQSATLTAITNTPGGNYSWSNGEVGPTNTITPQVGTTYILNYTGPNGCISTASGSVVVRPEIVFLPNSVTICPGETISISGETNVSGGSYSWSTGQTAQTISINPSQSTFYTVTYTVGQCAPVTDTVYVTISPNLSVSLPAEYEICTGFVAQIAPVYSHQGLGTYQWSNGISSSNFGASPLVTTSYTLTFSKALCIDTVIVTTTVIVKPKPTLSIPSVTTCSGQSATLTAITNLPEGNYLWSTGQTTSTNTISPTVNTSYSLIYTAPNGCYTNSSGIVVVRPPIVFSTNSVTICPGETRTISASTNVTGGTYLWSTGQTTQSISVNPSETTFYTVTYTVGQCAPVSDTSYVTVTPSLSVSLPEQYEICSGTSLQITPTYSHQGFGTYQWSNGLISQSFSISPSSTTTLTVTYSKALCSGTATASTTIIVKPTPTITQGSITVCLNQPAVLSPTISVLGGTYLWSNGATTPSITINQTILTTTNYTLTYNLNGCTATRTISVFASNPPSLSVNSLTICSGSSGNLLATASPTGGTFLWSTGQTTSQINVSPTSNSVYTVTYTRGFCNPVTASSTVSVINALNVTTVDYTTCPGQSTTISPTYSLNNIGQYLWSNGATTSSITVTPNTTTSYSVTYSIPNCSSSFATSSSSTVNVTQSNITFSPTETICLGQTISISPNVSQVGGTYLWSTGATTSSIIVSPTTSSTYTLTYTLNGCSSSASKSIVVVSAPTINLSHSTICPNPNPLTVTATVSPSNSTLLWSTGATTTTTSLNIQNDTVYSVVASLNGCSSLPKEITVASNIALNSTINGANVCPGSPFPAITITPSHSGGTYIWSSGQTTNSITPTLTGLYTVTYNLVGCNQATRTFPITQDNCDFSQNSCENPNNLCTAVNFTYPNSTNKPNLGNVDCLGSTPNPTWFTMTISQAGTLNLLISQNSNSGQALDVDYIAWGPFNTTPIGCAAGGFPSGPVASCSYSGSNTENVTLNNVQVGQKYIFLLTNFSNQAGNISVVQNNTGSGSADCSVICDITEFTAIPTACVNNQYNLTGTLTFENPPSIGTLTVSNSCGGSQVFNPPFISPLTYNITSLNANGSACSLTAVFSASSTCNSTASYTAPIACVLPCSIQSVTAVPSACLNNQYSLSGTVTFTNPPSTGTLTVSNSCGGFQTFNAPFTSPLNYSITGLVANGASCTISATFSANMSCSASTNFSAPAACVLPCSIQSVTAVPSACLNNQYSLSGTVSFTNPPSTGTLTITNSCGGTQTFNSPFTSPIAYSFSDLTADGANCTVNTVFSANASCTASTNFSAPAACVLPCSIQSATAVPSACLNNQYSLSGTVTFTNPPSTGTLTITNSCGGTQTFNSPFTSPIAYSFSDLTADGANCTVNTVFSANASCTATTSFTAPTSCSVSSCVIQSINGVPSICSSNLYSLDGVLIFSNPPSTGTLTLTACGFTQTFSPPFSSPLNFSFPDMAANGNSCSISATFSDIPCTGSSTFFAPIPCDCGLNTISISGPSVVCAGQPETLTANPALFGGTYLWSPNGETTQSITITPTAFEVYAVYYTLSTCFQIGEAWDVDVIEPTQPIFNQVGDICFGDALSSLPGMSINSILGGWSPSMNNQETTTYTFTPNQGICANTTTMTIGVNSGPTFTLPQNQSICVGDNFATSVFADALSGTIFSWTNDNPAIGLAASGSGDIIGFEGLNTTTSNQTATISVVASLNGCSTPAQTFDLTVKPRPTAISSISNQDNCCGNTSTEINFTSDLVGTTYNWTNDNPNIGLGTSGSGTITAFTVVNPTSVDQTATLTVTPELLGCAGIPITTSILAHPCLTVSNNSFTPICDGETTQPIQLTSSVAGVTFDWTNSNTSIGLAASGNGVIPSFTGVNTSQSPNTANISVIPSLGTCSGDAVILSLVVNPIPSVTVNSLTICEGQSGTLTAIPSILGGTYAWTPIGQTSSSITVNPTTNSTYSVVYTSNGCSSNAANAQVDVTPAVAFAISASGPTTINQGESVVLTSSYTSADAYQWYYNGQAIAGANTISYSANTTGNYSLQITVGTCPSTSQIVTVTVQNETDTDGDGVPDNGEVLNGTDPTEPCDFVLTNQTLQPTTAWNQLDCDADGLGNGTELTDGTNPQNPDTDGDGVIDGTEVGNNTNPLEPCDLVLANQTLTPSNDWHLLDCDTDGVTNETEILNGTNPLNEDTDGDGVSDGVELNDLTDANDPCSFILANQNLTPSANWLSLDCDGDDLTNGEEGDLGTDPLDPDTDGDTFPDGGEVDAGTDPLDPNDYPQDADGDGVPDNTELADGTNPNDQCDFVLSNQVLPPSTIWNQTDCDLDGVLNQEELLIGTNPLNPDTDADGVIDGTEITDNTNPLDPCDLIVVSQTILPATNWNLLDCDTDGLTNGNEITANTDPFNPDTDGDGVMDGTEVTDATNPLGNCSFVLANQTLTPSTEWTNLDCDFDGLPNGEEVTIGSNPLNPDTDGDGVKDSQEITDNTSPINPCSFILSSQTLVPTTVWNQQDCDTDGLTNEEEVTEGTNPTNEDTDGDGVIDGTEIADATNPLEACSFNLTSQTVTPSLAWSSLDCDEDGLTNEEEVTGGTNPTNNDTDGDGVIDGTEISDLTDPLVACNFILASQTVAPSLAWNTLDCDEDGLTNEEEIIGGSNPLNGCDPNNTGPNCQDTVLLQIPEIFTPNNDGINETFEIPGIEDYPNNSIQIFNRWGAEVFSKTAYQNEWNGSTTSNLVIGEGELPTGTYYYILDLNSDGSTIYKGYVYLKR